MSDLYHHYKGEASPTTQPAPLNSNSIVIDSQVSIALDKAARGEPLNVAEQAAVDWIARKRGVGVEIRETDTTVTEVKEKNENYQPFQKVPMTVDYSSPEYQAVVGELENNNGNRSQGYSNSIEAYNPKTTL